jgi:excisionase family DNA binding protein
MPAPNIPKLLNVKETAELLGVSPSYLNKLRLISSEGPPFVKLGARVCYDPADLAAWVNSQKRRSTSDTGEAGS